MNAFHLKKCVARLAGTTTTGPNPKIERAYMDGTERKIIATEGVFWPNGLAIDYPAGKIYWADAKHHVIESCHYDGSNRKKVTPPLQRILLKKQALTNLFFFF